METPRFLKILGMALRTDASEAEAQVAFSKVREGLANSGCRLEDVIPSPEGIAALKKESEEIQRIIKLSNADYALLVTGLQTQVKDLTADVASKDKEIAKLTRSLAKAKLKPAKAAKPAKIEKPIKVIPPKPGEELFVGPVAPSGWCKAKRPPSPRTTNKRDQMTMRLDSEQQGRRGVRSDRFVREGEVATSYK